MSQSQKTILLNAATGMTSTIHQVAKASQSRRKDQVKAVAGVPLGKSCRRFKAMLLHSEQDQSAPRSPKAAPEQCPIPKVERLRSQKKMCWSMGQGVNPCEITR